MMRRFHEAEEEAEETEEAFVVSKRSGKKKDDDVNDDDDFQQNNNNLLLLPCWRAVARKLRVASARDAQKEVLRRAGWETCVLSCCSPPQYNVSCDDARAFSLSLSLSLSLFRARRLRVVVVVVVVYFLTTDALTFLRFSVCALRQTNTQGRERLFNRRRRRRRRRRGM